MSTALMFGVPMVDGDGPLMLTQTVVGQNGNCWQTCVACILRIDPAAMPDQSTIERVIGQRENGKPIQADSYNNPLQAYLREHHRLTLAHAWGPLIGHVRPLSFGGYHLVYGPSVRTQSIGVDHVVVARDGATVWDPHPSRAGILKATSWGMLVHWPDDDWDIDMSRAQNPCVCPQCAVRDEPKGAA